MSMSYGLTGFNIIILIYISISNLLTSMRFSPLLGLKLNLSIKVVIDCGASHWLAFHWFHLLVFFFFQISHIYLMITWKLERLFSLSLIRLERRNWLWSTSSRHSVSSLQLHDEQSPTLLVCKFQKKNEFTEQKD